MYTRFSIIINHILISSLSVMYLSELKVILHVTFSSKDSKNKKKLMMNLVWSSQGVLLYSFCFIYNNTPLLLFFTCYSKLIWFFFSIKCALRCTYILLISGCDPKVKTAFFFDSLFATHFIKRFFVYGQIPENNHNPLHKKYADNRATLCNPFTFSISNGENTNKEYV